MNHIFTEKEKKIRDKVKQFVEEDLNPISLQVELEGRIPGEIVDKTLGKMFKTKPFSKSQLEIYKRGGLLKK